jgi:hypothetical protein
MSKDKSADERAAREKFAAWLREIEAAAAEIVEVGDLLFSRGEPSDPALRRRYQLYTRAKAALALPHGPERIAALQANGRKICCVRRKAAEPNEAARTFRLNRAEGEEWRMGRTLVDCSGAYDPDTVKLLCREFDAA